MLYYVNGGHENPVIIGEQGIKMQLEPTGPAVGMIPDMQFDVRQMELLTGDLLIVYTDGVTEARNPDGALYGEKRLFDLLCQPVESASASITRIEYSLREFTSRAALSDDITLLAVYRK